jgi:hypothetical protein
MAFSDQPKSTGNKTQRLLGSHWYFLFVSIFFVTHGYLENVRLIPFWDIALLLVILLVFSLLVFWFFRWLLKTKQKSALFTFLFLLITLFFGVVQDFAERQFGDSFFSRISFLSLLAFVILFAGFFLIRKSRNDFKRIPVFLNLLFAIYIIVDLSAILVELQKHEKTEKTIFHEPIKISPCDSCAKPPVYLVLLDEYSGTSSLQKYFNYDNSGFEDSLSQLGFHVIHESHSNYYYTVYSMASMLNLDYIKDFKRHGVDDDEGYHKALMMIKNNFVVQQFVQEGYQVKNYSYFELEKFPAIYKNDYLPGKINLIIHKTMYVRLIGQVLNKIGMGRPLVVTSGDWEEEYIKNNNAMMERVLNEKQDSVPSFTYVHLMMPHEPFSFNSKGERIQKWVRSSSRNIEHVDAAYLEYLIYTNKKIYQFIKQLQSNTNGKAVIMLMSDHAYRGFERKGDMKLLYSNLNAVYLPGKQYEQFKDGTTNVNQFRILFSALFNHHVPLLKNELIP